VFRSNATSGRKGPSSRRDDALLSVGMHPTKHHEKISTNQHSRIPVLVVLGLLMVTMVVPFCGIGCRKGDSAEPAPLVEVSGLEFGKCLPDNEPASGLN
jgi:hypothetical protein